MTFEELITRKEYLAIVVNNLSNKLQQFPKEANGMTPDHVRATEEFRVVNTTYNETFNELRATNQYLMKHYKKEYMSYRKRMRVSK